jgi:hypothetical protein
MEGAAPAATHVYGMEPSDGQRRTVLGVSLAAQAVARVHGVVPAALRAGSFSGGPSLFLVLVRVLIAVFFRVGRRLWRAGRLGGAAARAPRREGADADRQKAWLGLRGRHAVERAAAALEHVGEPALLPMLRRGRGESRPGERACAGGRAEPEDASMGQRRVLGAVGGAQGAWVRAAAQQQAGGSCTQEMIYRNRTGVREPGDARRVSSLSA